MAGVSNIKLVIEYEGTRYCGWQVQPNGPTIQEKLELAIRQITGETVRIFGAGRTDAGVHASGQVANFHTACRMSAERMCHALNAVLPDDIVVLDLSAVPESFHARYSAKSKRYRYTILNRTAPSAIHRHHSLHLAQPLDIAAMREAAGHLIGTWDFSSFGCNAGREDDPVRTVLAIAVDRQGNYLTIEIEAVSFLYKMVRSIVGTLIDVGKGKMQPSDVLQILKDRDRKKASATAPAKGLTLVQVNY
jgi:tRNA pseudouridine38-40 synthase